MLTHHPCLLYSCCSASNASFNVTVIPTQTTTFDDQPATISYDYMKVDAESGEEEVVKRVGFSTTNGGLKIMSVAEFLKATATFVVEWTIFGLMGSLTIILPGMAWVSITTQNEILVGELKIKTKKGGAGALPEVVAKAPKGTKKKS